MGKTGTLEAELIFTSTLFLIFMLVLAWLLSTFIRRKWYNNSSSHTQFWIVFWTTGLVMMLTRTLLFVAVPFAFILLPYAYYEMWLYGFNREFTGYITLFIFDNFLVAGLFAAIMAGVSHIRHQAKSGKSAKTKEG